MKTYSLVLLAVCLLVPHGGIRAQKTADRPDSVSTAPLSSSAEVVPVPSGVTLDVTSMESFRSDSVVVFNDYVRIRVRMIDSILAYQQSIPRAGAKDTSRQLILYLNGNPIYDVPLVPDRGNRQFIFRLSKESKFLKQYHPEFTYMWSGLPARLRIGFRNGTVIDAFEGPAVTLKYISAWAFWWVLILLSGILAGFLYLARRTTLIRAGKTISDPFSLGLTQLSFWTIIVSMSYFYIWIATQSAPPVTNATLILLGISLTTTAGAKLVDKRMAIPAAGIKPSAGFFSDILSDDDGPSLNRCQMFLWTVILMIIFVTKVVTEQQMPELGKSLLALMGISSAGYVGLKQFEKKAGRGAKD